MTSSTTMATASASSSPTKPPDPSSTHRLSAAADLIRNLDAALSSMNHAASAAARDAAKARRNAKAAGEVARRYGGSGGPSSSLRVNTGVHGGGSFGKRKSPRGTPKAASAMTKDERLKEAEQRALERKWERRTAARLAAEARQRRESPRKEGGTGGGGNGLAGFRAAVEETVERSHGYYDHGSPGKSSGSDARGAAADTAFEGNDSKPPPQVSNESSDDRTADGTADFEDALDHIHSEESNSSEHRRYEDPQQHYDQSQKNWKQHTEDQVTQHDYYNQQQQYYGQQQGQQQYYNQNESQEEYYNRMQQDQSQYEQAWQSSAQQQQNQPQWQQQPQTQLPASATTTATGRIAASNAEDVLALSLELERTRSQLAQTTTTLESTQAEMASLQTSHSHLQSENDRLTKELSTTKESTSSKIQDLTQKYQQEAVRAKAAEEDAALALDLAKEAQAAKEEVETWLGRSLEEIDVWKKRAKELEGLLQQQGSFSGGDSGQGYYEGATEEGFTSPDQKKFVRFADQNDTPVSPLAHSKNNEATSQFQTSLPPPAPATPTSRSSNAPSPSSTSVNTSTQTIEGTSNNENSTPSKSAIATGRAWLHRNSPLLSPPGSSTSSLLSPDPKLKAAELLKRSAETTKLLREKLRHGNSISKPTAPPSLALIAATAANAKHSGGNSGEGSALSMLNDNSFATRQGAACRAVGKFIRESGKRLELEGKWWDHPRKVLTDGGAETETNEPILFHGVAELESMVKDYCGTVEGTIGKQKEKIEELVAFCDLLEKEVVNVRVNQEGGGDGIGSATAVAGTF